MELRWTYEGEYFISNGIANTRTRARAFRVERNLQKKKKKKEKPKLQMEFLQIKSKVNICPIENAFLFSSLFFLLTKILHLVKLRRQLDSFRIIRGPRLHSLLHLRLKFITTWKIRYFGNCRPLFTTSDVYRLFRNSEHVSIIIV